MSVARSLLAAVLLSACAGPDVPDERARRSITHFTERSELFVEFPALVKGDESPFAVHLTRLDDFKPVVTGQVTIVLSGGAPEERFHADAPQQPGIFRAVVTPTVPGERELTVVVDADGVPDSHELGRVTVHGTAAAAKGDESEEGAGPALITFLKEQQWRIDFATMAVEEKTLRESFRANGSLRARPGGEALVSAPVTGRLLTTGELPGIGAEVERDQPLAAMVPRLEGDADPASLELAVERARRDVDLARRERQRLERLLAEEAVPERRVIAARHEERDAEGDLAGAEHRLAQFRAVHRAGGGDTKGQVSVRSPLRGTIAEVLVAAGEFIGEGRPMFRVVDLETLWLETRIPEADVGRAVRATGAWFEVEGFDRRFEVEPARGGRVVALGGVIDPQSRTAPLILELPNPDRTLRVGMSARVHVLTGEIVTGPAIPASAIVDDQGESVAYVQVAGESFERRTLTLGVRDADLVQVRAGLRPGERVVTRGAYHVRLAAASGAVPAHGHAH